MPLAGVRVAVTRAAAQAAELADPLTAAGAEVLLYPLIRIEPRPLDAELKAAIEDLASFDWIILTSVNGVHLFMSVLERNEHGRAALRTRRVACVGPATAAALRRYGCEPSLIPDQHVGNALAAALGAQGPLTGKKILIPRAEGGAQALPDRLREGGAQVHDLALYRSIIDQEGAQRLKAGLSVRKIDLVTFTSGSAVKYFVHTVGLVYDVVVAVIGPSTAGVAREQGLPVHIEAKPHTTGGLVNSIIEYYAATRGNSEAKDAGE